MHLYFAAPLFSNAELQYNEALTARIEAIGYAVYLPQRDGPEKGRPPYNILAPDVRRRTIFETDRDHVLAADVLLMVLDGRVPDEGACFELGVAYTQQYLTGQQKLLIGLHTDARAAFVSAKLNPMLGVPLAYIAADEEDLLARLRLYLATGCLDDAG